MGHYIDIMEAFIIIKDEKTVAAREAVLVYLNTREELKYHSWLQEFLSKDQGMITLVDVLREMGWHVEEGENGDIHITGQDDEMKYSRLLYDDLFAVLAPFIEDGGKVKISDASHDMSVWYFSGGKMFEDELVAVPRSSLKALGFAGIDIWQTLAEYKGE